jgi:hypothetical protein
VEYLLETLSNNLDDAPTTQGAANETLILHAERFAIRTGEAGAFTYPLIIADIVGVPTVVLDTAIIRDGTIQSGQIGALTFGKLVAADGFTPITTVSGLLKADYIDADNLSVASAATFYGNVQSGNFTVGSAGWRILQAGGVEFNSATVRGHIEADSGYIASTLQIGGTPDSLATVRNNASSAVSTANTANSTANAAKAKTDDWTRPGQTLIDGNKIFAGDAYVDTLQIQGNAITVPASGVRASLLYLDSSYATVCSTSYAHGLENAVPGIIMVTIEASSDTSNGEGGTIIENEATMTFQVIVNGAIAGSYSQFLKGRTGISCTRFLEYSLPVGAYTIYVRALRSGNGGCRVYTASFVVLGAKR